MKVLGISPLDKDSTITIVEDGVIKYAAAEERFTCVKLQDGFPWRALENGLAATAVTVTATETTTHRTLDDITALIDSSQLSQTEKALSTRLKNFWKNRSPKKSQELSRRSRRKETLP